MLRNLTVSTVELRQLIDLAFKTARFAANRDPDFEILSEAQYAMFVALRSFDSERGELVPWVKLNVTRAIQTYYRKMHSMPLSSVDLSAVIDPWPQRIGLYEAIDSLPHDDRELAELHWICDMPLCQLAYRKGVKLLSIRLSIERIRKQLRSLVNIEDN